MTDREKAIVMAYTGICMLEGEKFGVFYQYLEGLYGRPVYTHEWATLDIKEKSKPDFLQLCKEEEPEPCEDAVSREAAIDIFDDYNVSVENGELEAYSRDRKRLCDLPSAQPDGIPLEWIDKHLEWLDNCDNDFAQLAKVSIRAMVEIWKKDKT